MAEETPPKQNGGDGSSGDGPSTSIPAGGTTGTTPGDPGDGPGDGSDTSTDPTSTSTDPTSTSTDPTSTSTDPTSASTDPGTTSVSVDPGANAPSLDPGGTDTTVDPGSSGYSVDPGGGENFGSGVSEPVSVEGGYTVDPGFNPDPIGTAWASSPDPEGPLFPIILVPELAAGAAAEWAGLTAAGAVFTGVEGFLSGFEVGHGLGEVAVDIGKGTKQD